MEWVLLCIWSCGELNRRPEKFLWYTLRLPTGPMLSVAMARDRAIRTLFSLWTHTTWLSRQAKCVKTGMLCLLAPPRPTTSMYLPRISSPRCAWAGYYNVDTNYMFIHKYEKNEDLGRKFCCTNAFRKSFRVRNFDGIIPVYDLYKLTFAACDTFNRQLHDRKWPHRRGSGKRTGDDGHHDKFAMGCILQSTFNAYKLKADPDRGNMCFKLKCFALANVLYERSAYM